MSFTKSSTSILISKALHFLIKLALKNRKRIDDIKDLCNMSAFIHCIMLIYSLNVSNDSLFFRKLQVHLTM